MKKSLEYKINEKYIIIAVEFVLLPIMNIHHVDTTQALWVC